MEEYHISFWIGKGEDQDAFHKLLDYSISEDGLGDFMPAPFCREIGILKYDPDFFGGRIYRRPMRLSLLIKGENCAQKVVEDWPDPPESNCCVILCGEPYLGEIKEFTLDGFTFHFLGAYRARTRQPAG